MFVCLRTYTHTFLFLYLLFLKPPVHMIDQLRDALVVFDDMMDEANERLTRVFTHGSGKT